ncbi:MULTISPECIES: glycerophosphodiester phosphodiesterase family protein [Rhodomicrobium]|uniref:glycerophosphodiester phosphodiesterase family protein n=2 Tax=Rhodomicrobium TaxID=1068 RepID=UPI000B4B9A7F
MSGGFLILGALAAGMHLLAPPAFAQQPDNIQLGPRPFFLVDRLDDGPLKEKLKSCANGPFRRTAFSIGHRGAAMQFPEHTEESYRAGARMGAGIVECDVTFTKDKQLVCRHSQCDLHTTTNILGIPDLAAKCTQPFTPADPSAKKEASAKCCTSDLTLAEFRRLKGKMDAFDKNATTPEAYMGGTASWRTDLYAASGGKLMTHAESIKLFQSLGVKFTPELKAASVPMPFDGDFTQAAYAQKMIDEYKAAGIDPKDVFPQSFNLEDVRYWIANAPEFGKQGVYLDERDETLPGFDPLKPESWKPGMKDLAASGVKIIAPPLWMLVTLDEAKKIVPSPYAKAAKEAGLEIIAWTLERSGPLKDGGGWYYQSIKPAVSSDGDMLKLLDVLAKDVGIRGIFSDWPATVTYYANCMGLE